MSNLSKLPKLSETFLAHIEDRTLEKNEWMPCPRCGEGTVEPPSGALAGGCLGFGLIGCWLWILGIGAIILGIIFWPAAIGFIILGLIVIPFLPILGVGIGMSYSCKSCGYSWTFKDVENLKEGIKG